MMSQDKKINFGILYETREMQRRSHQLMKGIWNEDFASPVKQELTERKDFKVLDVGCGSGEWTLQLSENYPLANFTGLDLLTALFPKEFSQKNLKFVKGDILKGLPFENDSFDFVHMRMLLMLFSQIQLKEIVIKELIRVCKPGGWIELVDFDIDGKSTGPIYNRILALFMKFLETKGINGLISEELPELIENTDQVYEVHTDEVYRVIGSWGGETGKLFLETFVSVLHKQKDMPKLAKMSEEEYNTMIDQFVEETKHSRSYYVATRFYCQKIISE